MGDCPQPAPEVFVNRTGKPGTVQTPETGARCQYLMIVNSTWHLTAGTWHLAGT